jgi:hypothetical protein
VLGGTDFTGVLELRLLGCQTVLHVLVVTVLDVAMLHAGHLVAMLFWEDLAVLNGLDGGVVVVLVNLAVDGSGHILLTGGGGFLVLNCRIDHLGA